MKTETGFVIKSKHDMELLPSTFRYQAKTCKSDWLHPELPSKWKEWYKSGWRCVKVTVTITEI